MTATFDTNLIPDTQTKAECFSKNMACYMYAFSEQDSLETMGFHAITDDTIKINLLKNLAVFFNETFYRSRESVEETTLTKEDEFNGMVSDACYDFCNSHGLFGLLRQIIKQVNISFSNVTNLYADYDSFNDDENDNLGHIVLRFIVKNEQKTYLEEYDQWFDWIANNIPPDRMQFITISPKRV